MMDSPSLSPLTTFRLTATVVIWFLGLVGGLSPLWISSSPMVVSLLNMVAGGVFLAASLLHLLPDAAHNVALQDWQCPSSSDSNNQLDEIHGNDDSDCGFPWAYFFFGVGFLLVLLLETFAHALERIYGLGEDHGDDEETETDSPMLLPQAKLILPQSQSHQHDHSHQHPPANEPPHSHNNSTAQRPSSVRSSSLSESIPLILNTESTLYYNTASNDHRKHPNSLSNCDDEDDATSSLMTVDCRKTIIAHMHVQSLLGTHSQRKSIDTDSMILVDNPLTPVAALVFVALSFHSIMEGLAMGAQLTPAWDIFAAIVAHKALAGFALGQELLSHHMSRQRLCTSILVFAGMTPLGVLLGWWTTRLSLENPTHGDATESAASGICVALAGGTFLFVAVMEIIPQEMQDKQMLRWKSLALLAGFGGFGILARWV